MFDNNYIGSLISIPQKRVLSYCSAPSLRGATNLRYTVYAYNRCSKFYEHKSQEEKKNCDAVRTAFEKYKELKVQIDSDKDNPDVSESMLKFKLEELEKRFDNYKSLVRNNCAHCKNYSVMFEPESVHRLSLRGVKECESSLSTIRTMYASYAIVEPHASSEKFENANFDLTEFHIGQMIKMTGLSDNSVRAGLKQLETDNVITCCSDSRGHYSMALTEHEDNEKYLKGESGGLGSLILPAETISVLLEIERTETLRLLSLALVELNRKILAGDFIVTKDGKNIEVTFNLLPFLKRSVNRSMKEIIDNFNYEINKILGMDYAYIYPRQVKCPKPDKIDSRNDGRYKSAILSFPIALCPRQNDYDAMFMLTRTDKLVRGISDRARREIIAASARLFGSVEEQRNGCRGHLIKAGVLDALLPFHLRGTRVSGGEERINFIKIETLIPVVEKIDEKFGARYLFNSIIKTFAHFKSRATKICEKPLEEGQKRLGDVPAFRELISEMSAYMFVTARKMRGEIQRDWRIMAADMRTFRPAPSTF